MADTSMTRFRLCSMGCTTVELTHMSWAALHHESMTDDR
jgi:hypothetical protein